VLASGALVLELMARDLVDESRIFSTCCFAAESGSSEAETPAIRRMHNNDHRRTPAHLQTS
jgi:hypothetical protein